MQNNIGHNRTNEEMLSTETKISRAMCVLMVANKYKYDLPKFAEFIEKNRSYFPHISDQYIEQIKNARLKDTSQSQNIKDNVPVFAPLNKEFE